MTLQRYMVKDNKLIPCDISGELCLASDVEKLEEMVALLEEKVKILKDQFEIFNRMAMWASITRGC